MSWIVFSSSLTSCTTVKNIFNFKKPEKKIPKINYVAPAKYAKDDFIVHLKVFEKFYLKDTDVKLVKLYDGEKKYLTSLVKTIISSNELFFDSAGSPEIFIINDKRPFYFSLPSKKIFISLRLFKKYLKNEHILASVLAYELVRSEKNIYKKNIIAPTGVMSTERIITLLRIGLEYRSDVHKWAYYLVKRSGFDSSIYLNWIQVQNRNSIDFKFFYGDTSIISREEALFKGFLIRKNKKSIYDKAKVKSSKKFFRLINRIGKIKYEA
jgi:hypothetical protein